jgi:hypothetical protein
LCRTQFAKKRKNKDFAAKISLSFHALSLCDAWEKTWVQLTTAEMAEQYQQALADKLSASLDVRYHQPLASHTRTSSKPSSMPSARNIM